jgi:hypothetical protein
MFSQFDYFIVPETVDHYDGISPDTVTGIPYGRILLQSMSDTFDVSSYNISASDEFRCGIWRCPLNLDFLPYIDGFSAVPETNVLGYFNAAA